MGKLIDLTGKKFGRLIILNRDKKSKDIRIRWIALCTFCNQKFSIRSNNLISKKVSRCLKCKQTPDPKLWVGKTIGKYLITKFLGFSGSPITGFWLGIDKHRNHRKLKTAYLKSKIGTKKSFYSDKVSAIKTLYRKYKYGATSRNLVFKLSLKEFENLIFKNCYYCNSIPNNKQKSKNKNAKILLYNGIDRKYNNKGYLLTNVVSCCIICNRAKSNMSFKNWKIYINKLITNQKKEWQ